MDTINITKTEYEEILSRLNEISKEVSTKRAKFSEPWIDNADLMQLLKVSRRTLQNYRDNRDIAFSIIGNKLYYKMSDVEDLLNRNYKKRML